MDAMTEGGSERGGSVPNGDSTGRYMWYGRSYHRSYLVFSLCIISKHKLESAPRLERDVHKCIHLRIWNLRTVRVQAPHKWHLATGDVRAAVRSTHSLFGELTVDTHAYTAACATRNSVVSYHAHSCTVLYHGG